MSKKRHLQNSDICVLACAVAESLYEQCLRSENHVVHLYPIPRGGVPAAYAAIAAFNAMPAVAIAHLEKEPDRPRIFIAGTPEEATAFIDDLVDSGKTQEHYLALNPHAPFYALVTKGVTPSFPLGEWLVFPWENSEAKSIEDSFVRLLQYIGEDVTREGLKETPSRMAKAWKEWTAGYHTDPTSILKQFEDGAEGTDEMVQEVNIPFYSQCEHHLAPFFGTVSFGYIPNKRVVGLSKMNRLVEVFARRLQVQERLTCQIIDTFNEVIQPLGAGIVVRARHMCVESRGIKHTGCETITRAFRGVIKTDSAARAEFLTNP